MTVVVEEINRISRLALQSLCYYKTATLKLERRIENKIKIGPSDAELNFDYTFIYIID